MIVPGNRLLLWVAAIGVPLAAAEGLIPSLQPTALAVAGLFLVVVLIDAAWAWRSLDALAVEYPGVARLTKDRPGKVPLRILNGTRKACRIRVGIPLPPEIQSENETLLVEVPGESDAARIEWECTPTRRGNYVLDSCYLETNSPIGFWCRRKRHACRGEIRVYPNLYPERRNLAGLFLNRGGYGIHAQRLMGKGRDFEKLREYIPGDSYDEIHWKATAKRGRPVTKVFQVERTQEILVVIDSSRLSAKACGTQQGDVATQVTLLERFISAALILCQVTERQGDLFGLVTFGQKVFSYVPPRNGAAHYGRCRDALYALEPQIATPDYDELFSFIRTRLRRRALLVILTSLEDATLAESFARKVDLIARNHLVLVNMPTPASTQPLFSSADVQSHEDLYAHLAGHLRWHELQELQTVLKRKGVSFSLLDNERICSEIVSQYLNVKQRQVL